MTREDQIRQAKRAGNVRRVRELQYKTYTGADTLTVEPKPIAEEPAVEEPEGEEESGEPEA